MTLLVGAYAPALVVFGLRHGVVTRRGPDWAGIGVCAAGVLGAAWWITCLESFVTRRQAFELTLTSAEPADRDVTAYIASYILPILAAKPGGLTDYLAYGLAAALILVVAYRADLGAINPLAYVLGYRSYRISAEDGVRIVLSRWRLDPGSTWQMQEAAGMVVTKSQTNEQATGGRCRWRRRG
jgi:hypothetical protein